METPVVLLWVMFTRSPSRLVSTSVIAMEDSSTPVTNSAGFPSSSVPTLTREVVWDSSATEVDTRAEEVSSKAWFSHR